MSTPQVFVTLAPSGQLVCEWHFNGMRRQVPLKSGHEGETLQRILQAQLRSEVQIGEDGAPTAHQVRHWERHQIWRDPQCPFCIAEGHRPQLRARARTLLISSHGQGSEKVEVRRLPPKVKGKARKIPRQVSTAEFGF